MTHKKLSEIALFVPVSRSVLWRYLVHPDFLPLWYPEIESVAYDKSIRTLTTEDITNSMRVLTRTDGRLERHHITDCQPAVMLGYEISNCPEFECLPLAAYRQQYALFAEENGTELQWVGYYECATDLSNLDWLDQMIQRTCYGLDMLKTLMHEN